MRIRQLNVKGYRSLRDVVLTGLGDFTVIYGDNNTGKSNVLAFLEMVFAPKIVKTSASPQGGLVSP
ncbi:MAG: AAA family ATPase, partial [Armatimonadetes bacterium]|nr:AAA family ATPase [Armatimonadota bacterium]